MSQYSHDRNNLDDPIMAKAILTFHHNVYIEKCRESFPNLPEKWLQGSENYYEWLSGLGPKECIEEVAGPTLYALNLLLNTDVGLVEDIQSVCEKVFSDEKDEQNLEPWQFDKLFSDVQEIRRNENAKIIIETHSLIMTVCGLLSIFFPAITRCRIHLIRQNAEDEWNIGFSDIIMQGAQGSKSTREVIEKSYNNLIQSAINIRPKLHEPERDDFNFPLGEAIRDAFSPYKDALDGLEAAGTGNVKVTHIAKRVSDRYLRSHINESNYKYLTESLDTPLSADSELTFKDLHQVDSELEMLEDRELIHKCMNKINDPNLLTVIQRKVVKTFFGLTDGQPHTYRETGDLLGIEGSTVYEHLKAALSKLSREIPS